MSAVLCRSQAFDLDLWRHFIQSLDVSQLLRNGLSNVAYFMPWFWSDTVNIMLTLQLPTFNICMICIYGNLLPMLAKYQTRF